ncbi:hypothetical protein [Opitutus sp. ER46]|uniref:hypothetical protein n=1 Tax=Opitutus sp. ER46 TaxID=2161864 RepID=UPI000D300B66|nr:hypothetical protein [Opitutus sp. ER46]PTX91253.1 hypothetical protein DB354_21735 [Opitutus sp. ER46]
MKPLSLLAAFLLLRAVSTAEVAPFAMPPTRPTPNVATPAPGAVSPEAVADNPELARLFREDQDDRQAGQVIDWSKVIPRDAARVKRAKELYNRGLLRTGGDYFHAAMVLQRADAADDFLLAHELCIVALLKGEKRARWLAAASEDRFLLKIGRPQRFGTQYRGRGDAAAEPATGPAAVSDALRREFNVTPAPAGK